MTPDDEAQFIAPTTKFTRLQSLGHALTRVRQRICARSASVYAWGQAWVAERQPQEVIRRAGQEIATCVHTSATNIEGLIKTRLLWLQLIIIVFTLIAGELKSVEPDTWLGGFFTSRFEVVEAGYQTLLQKKPLTQQDSGFPEILELALSSAQYVKDYIAKERVGPIETIIYTGQSGLAMYGWNSTLEHMFRSPLTVRLEDRQGKGVTARLGYTENDLKERFFMPTSRGWWRVVFYAGSSISVLLLILRFRESHQPTREG